MNYIFTSESFHMMDLGIYKLIEELLILNLSSDDILSHPGIQLIQRKPLR